MHKPLSAYSLEDWVRLRPIIQRLKTQHYDRIQRAYDGVPPRVGDLAILRSAVRGRRLLMTIAYEDPQVIDWQVRLVGHNIANVVHVIADNSHDDAKAAEIEHHAGRAGALYLRLPDNPWRRSQPSRSHGAAMTWLWANLVRPGEPAMFGFLDHDLWPTAPTDPFSGLASRPFDGNVRDNEGKWFLWAGFCFYRFDAVRHLPLDFRQAWFIGLDTGGGNWAMLYRDADRTPMAVNGRVPLPLLPDVPLADCYGERMGVWVHEVGLAGDPAHAARKRAAIADLLEPALSATRASGDAMGC